MLYSKRNKQQPDAFSYEVPMPVRHRILSTLHSLSQGDMHDVFDELARVCATEYGATMRRRGVERQPYEIPYDIGVEHFQACDDELVIDALEIIFGSMRYRAGQAGVDAVNKIFREEGIGYEFTRHVLKPPPSGDRYIHEKPVAIKKSNEQMHATVVIPTLTLLGSHQRWSTANSELDEAHHAYREGRFADSVVAVGKAFETVLKTIFSEKRWSYDPQRDTLSKLVEIGRAKNLFPEFYAEVFKAAGTVRNRLGAHGAGPTPLYQHTAEQADHMIQMTSAHILLVAKLAGLS